MPMEKTDMQNQIQKLYEENTEFRPSRLKSLFSDYIGLQETNFEGFQANLNIWKHFLEQVLSMDEQMLVNYEELKQKLKYRTGHHVYTPEGLYIAVNDMINTDRSMVVASKLNEGQRTGLLNLFKNMIIGRSEIDIRKESEGFSLESKLNTLSNQVCGCIDGLLQEGPINNGHLLKVLKEEGLVLKEHDLDVVLRYMLNRRNRKDIRYADGVIYPSLDGQKDLDTESLKKFTDLNYAIYKLERYNEAKHADLEKLDKHIREYVKAGNLIRAKSDLKIKKVIEIQVQKTIDNLNNLNLLKLKVEDAHNNLLISTVFKENGGILKELNEKVSDVDFDQLKEEVETTEQISSQLGAGFSDMELDVDEELAKLENEYNQQQIQTGDEESDKQVREIEEKLSQLKIPTVTPISKEQDEESAENKHQQADVAI